MILIMDFMDMRNGKVVEAKPVHTNNISHLVKVLLSYGYHILKYYEQPIDGDEIKYVRLGGYIDETEQSREVCPAEI